VFIFFAYVSPVFFCLKETKRVAFFQQMIKSRNISFWILSSVKSGMTGMVPLF